MSRDSLNLKPEVIVWLNDLRPEEADTLRQMIGMVHAAGDGDAATGVERVRSGLAMVRRFEGFTNIAQVIVLTGAGVLAAFAVLPEQVKSIMATISRALGGGK